MEFEFKLPTPPSRFSEPIERKFLVLFSGDGDRQKIDSSLGLFFKS